MKNKTIITILVIFILVLSTLYIVIGIKAMEEITKLRVKIIDQKEIIYILDQDNQKLIKEKENN